jgi:hypothetical protein
MIYEDRKPDKETELLRIWSTDKKKNKEEFEEMENIKDNNSFEIEQDGIKMQGFGFNLIREKETKEVIMAWKIKYPTDKNEEPFLLYYFNNTEAGKKAEIVLKPHLLNFANQLGFPTQDFRESLQSAKEEIKLLNKKGSKK